ncbi:GYP1 (YOR070C) [Zygosaccharomyces parabailii]|nr:GYP1 (YOR070C) [Zygosaccharomyces parabailii]
MGVRSGSKEMHQKDHNGSSYGYGYSLASSGTSLVSSLMKSWRISPSGNSSSTPRSSNNYPSNGNFDAMAKQQTTAMKSSSSSSSSYSPLRHGTPVSSSGGAAGSRRASTESPRPFSMTGSKHNNYYRDSGGGRKGDKYFKDLDEDWSAVIDDCNMPIPIITNGGVASPATPKVTRSSSVKTTPTASTTAIAAQNASSTFSYPHLPQLQKSLTSDLRSQLEVENEREAQELTSMIQRMEKFDCILNNKHIINQQELRQISWNGVPKPQRPIVWKLLIGYLPANTKRQESLLKRKRQEYCDGLQHIFSEHHSRDVATWHQIEIDVPRTNPHIPLYQFKSVQKSLQRILYLWAIRHPASGYVQGINDLSTPFFQTFLTEYLPQSQIDDVEKLDPETYLTESQLKDVEADTFWCLTKLLEQITDNYIHGQPGILKQVKNLSQLVKRIDQDLYNHFREEHVEFIQFAFRWMNCLLMREFHMTTVIRMWDTYLSETSLETSSSSAAMMSDTGTPRTPTEPASMTFQSFTSPSAPPKGSNEELSRLRRSSLNEFHVFVCAAFLIRWSDQLIDMDFQNIITFLQNPPTRNWKETDIEMLLSEAYIWQSLYKDATSHWQ